MTKISIIIPTLNRAHLLSFALKSAIAQDYKDLEIVVCDDYSEDNTREVVESFKNKNIIYIRTDKRLNIVDNFELALNKASGEYITFLTDTCYLLPNCISIAIRELEKFNVKLAVWKNCSYFYSDWIEPERRNTLYIPKVTYNSNLLDSKKILKQCYTDIRTHAPLMPRSINSLCHQSVIKKARNIQGRFFLFPLPDYSGVNMLLNTEKYLLIDQPLFVGSVSSANIGASQSFTFGESAQDCYKGLNSKLEDIAFLGIPTSSSAIAKVLENVRSFYLDSCPELNIKNVLCEIVDSLSKMEIYGTKVDLKDYWQILDRHVANQNNKTKIAVAKQKITSRLKWMTIKTIRFLPFLYYLEALRNVEILKGKKFKFNNVEEAAKVVEHRIQEKNLEV